jgi:hypothetical protein
LIRLEKALVARHRRRGMTVVELSLTLIVLMVAIGGTLRSISSFVVLSDGCWERSLAFAAAQRTLEQMQSETFSQVFARYNATPLDDPGAAPGEHFDVPGLDPTDADADGRVGRILFPVDPGAPAALFEDRFEPDFGLPRDLDADGDIDALDHAADYDLLPVRVQVQWRGRSGNRTVEVETVLRGR